ncbi:hypothetical protein NKI77_07890 [Mesorhizobium opportunistum]|uniref:Major tail protein n=1 Tax=Mesorhizobium opportunistum TaxID=593909 RepID=A0ABV1YBJ8_9HYPH|nr:hypothetical protein [Mesorhizobium sp.]TIN94364.1 MAG: hypothetical protein E5Y06_16635 [Mesorhizobium sp.]TJU96120.1 MAG: hypothetical protein E5Y08_23525 [Mesorhizobium sp.]TJV16288.1 MAG: hypothetical protein E5Y07_17915 [Mesorhizobium sp.]
MKIWVNAFIPFDVANYTVPLPDGEFTGMTAIPLPPLARLNPLNDGKPLGAGYLTDQRDFDSDISASCRMQSIADLSRLPAGWQLNNGFNGEHRTSGTTEVDIDTGGRLDSGSADMNRCTWTGGAVPEPEAGASFTQIFYLKAAAYDPLVSAAADIDYEGTFTLTSSPSADGDVVQIDWEVKLDSFPAFEGYVERDGEVTTLFTVPPPEGNTVEDLPGHANRVFSGSTTLFPNIVIGPDQ